MALQAVMSSQEKAEAARWVETENRRMAQEFNRRNTLPNQNLGKDDFLRILITQLSNQDPTAPMQDREFIAQMAQFSSLEQMTNMATDFAKMAQLLRTSEASGLLGRSVEITTENEVVQGVVQAVTRGEVPQILVKGRYFDWEHVSAVFNELE